MYDFSHLLYDPQSRLKIDFFTNASQNAEWQTWRKPAGAKFVYFFGVGGGGSGGCSSNSTSLSRNGGGSGGGGGSTMAGMIPAMFIPDILYVQVGLGGIPVVVSGGSGSAGGNTYVGVDQEADLHGLLIFAGGGAGGNPGNTSVGGVSAAGGIQSETAPPKCGLISRGIYNADSSLHNSTGQASSAGGAPGSGGASIVISTGSQGPSIAGSGGGGSGNATTSTTGSGGSLTLTMNANGSGASYGGEFWSNNAGGAAGSNGNSGWIMTFSGREIWYMGGTGGGGGNNTVSAGNGGTGSRGCGGGGAGGTWSLNTLAKPGNGGDGFVYIISYF